jgi:putative ABC transport system permease protein
MKFLLSLAWKNLFRHSRRTLITAAAIAVGLSVYIFMDSWLLGAEKESERNLIIYETASAQIMTPEYFREGRDNLSLSNTVEDPEQIINAVRKTGYAAAPRALFSGELIVYRDPYPEDGSISVRVEGIDPELTENVFVIHRVITEGRYLEQDEDAVLIGAGLAKKLGAEVGYPMLIKTKSKTGYFQTINVKVAGIFNSPNPIVNKTTVYMPLEAVDYYLELDGEITSVLLRFPFRENIDSALAAVQNSLDEAGVSGSLVVKDWKSLAPDYVAIAEAKRSGSGVMLLLVFVIAAVGITNTMLMAIYERIREIGMMRALGMTAKQIRRAFLLEAGGIGLIGSAVGIILGAGITAYMVYRGIDISFMLETMDIGYRISGMTYGAWHPAAFVGAFLSGIVLSMLTAYIPTQRALKWEITSCLRHQ